MEAKPECPVHAAALAARTAQNPELFVNKGLPHLRTEECKSCALCKEALYAIYRFAIGGNPHVFDQLLD